VLFVNKDGTLRLCIDFRKLDKVIVKNKYHFSMIEDIFDQLKDEMIFSKIDLTLGCNHVIIKEYDINRLTFTTRYGHYEFVVVLFGLSNALVVFMCFINGIFRNYLNKFFIFFFDDIFIYSKVEEEHENHLIMVLYVLRGNQLYVMLRTFSFYHRKIHYLGHIIS